jgi:hypothetical protein
MEERFLGLFLEECFSSEELCKFNFECKNAVVKTESYAPTEGTQGRIDILITSGAKRIVIENKLLAGDQKEQLKRYAHWSQKNSADFKILYLTKDGHEASEQSGDGIEYKTISYKEEILNWLNVVLKVQNFRLFGKRWFSMQILLEIIRGKVWAQKLQMK